MSSGRQSCDGTAQGAYAEYYAALNPWTPMWQAVESGTVLIAEEDCPARKFADTEFYNDWASPTERHVGIKIDGGPREVIHLPYIIRFPGPVLTTGLRPKS